MTLMNWLSVWPIAAIFLLLSSQTQARDNPPIARPILLHKAGAAAVCLEQAMGYHLGGPGTRVAEWRGPGLRADSDGAMDPSTAVYVMRVTNPAVAIQWQTQWFALAFYSSDDRGWGWFSYSESGQTRVGLRAASMERTGYLFQVKPGAGSSLFEDLSDPAGPEVTEIDLSSCEAELQKKP